MEKRWVGFQRNWCEYCDELICQCEHRITRSRQPNSPIDCHLCNHPISRCVCSEIMNATVNHIEETVEEGHQYTQCDNCNNQESNCTCTFCYDCNELIDDCICYDCPQCLYHQDECICCIYCSQPNCRWCDICEYQDCNCQCDADNEQVTTEIGDSPNTLTIRADSRNRGRNLNEIDYTNHHSPYGSF